MEGQGRSCVKHKLLQPRTSDLFGNRASLSRKVRQASKRRHQGGGEARRWTFFSCPNLTTRIVEELFRYAVYGRALMWAYQRYLIVL